MSSSKIIEVQCEIRDDYNKIWRLVRVNSKKSSNPLVEAARKHKNFSGIGDLIEEFLQKNPFNHHLVLDVGCGAGETVVKVRKLFPSAEVYGIDVSREAIKEAKKHSDAVFVCASADKLPFRSDLKFDMLIAGHTIDIFPNEVYLEKTIGELTKYSSERARFYMTFYGTDVQDLELDRCTPIGNTLTQFYWKIVHGDLYSFEKKSRYARGVFWVNERIPEFD